jgi:hypothetical protein
MVASSRMSKNTESLKDLKYHFCQHTIRRLTANAKIEIARSNQDSNSLANSKIGTSSYQKLFLLE